MKCVIQTSLVLIVIVTLRATSPLAFVAQHQLIDNLVETANGGTERGPIAVVVLEQIALGRASMIEESWTAALGLKPQETIVKDLAVPTVRAYALQKLGECDTASALYFIRGLKPSDLQADDAGLLWPAVQVGIAEAQTKAAPTTDAKIAVLRSALKTQAAAWAADQLCDVGALAALKDVQVWIRTARAGAPGERDAQFCEARMLLVARDPDRVRALSSLFNNFVSVAGSFDGRRLLSWAIEQLASIRSPQAEDALSLLDRDLNAILRQDPHAPNINEFRQQVGNLRVRQNGRH